MAKMLITGAAGLLGGNLCFLFRNAGYHVTGLFNERRIEIPEVEMISVADQNLFGLKPDIIIHCAAKTNVDECEKKPAEAYDVNVSLTEKMVELANNCNALLIHISTDAVYKDTPQVKNEEAPLEPLSVYAKSKLDAEKAVLNKARRFFIVRTNLFGYNILDKYSLAEWVYYNLKAGKEISGFHDVYFSPSLVNDLYSALHHMIRNNEGVANAIFNIGSKGGISKYEFAVAIAEIFGLDRNLIKKSSFRDFGFSAPRMENSVMDSARFEQTFSYNLPGIHTAIEHFYALNNEGYPQLLKKFNSIEHAHR